MDTHTKFMIPWGPSAPTNICKEAYDRRRTGNGKLYTERQREKVTCEICGKGMLRGSLQRHMLQQHNKKPEQYLYKENIRKFKSYLCTTESFSSSVSNSPMVNRVSSLAGPNIPPGIFRRNFLSTEAMVLTEKLWRLTSLLC